MSQAAHVFPSFTQNLGANAQKASTDGISVALIAAGSATVTWNSTSYAYTTLTQFLANSGGTALTEVSTSGTGYARQALSSVTFTESVLVNTLTAANPMWTALSAWGAIYAVFYDTTVSNDLICYWDFGGTSSVVTNGVFSLNVNTLGLVTWTSS